MNGNLTISENSILHSLVALQMLANIGGSVAISNNDKLESLDGLGNALRVLNGSLTIEESSALDSILALQNLTYVGGNITIKNIPDASFSSKTLDNLEWWGMT